MSFFKMFILGMYVYLGFGWDLAVVLQKDIGSFRVRNPSKC